MPPVTRRGGRSAAPEPPIPRVDTPRPRRAAAAAAAARPSSPLTALPPTAAALAAAAAAPPEDENEQRCSVCMEALPTKRTVSLDPCKHEFHRTCVLQWLETRCCTGAQQCPLCRAIVTSLTGDGQRKERAHVFGDSGQPTKRIVLASAYNHGQDTMDYLKARHSEAKHALARLRVAHDRFVAHAARMAAPASATYLADVVDEVEKLEQRARIYKEMKRAWRAGAMRTPISELPFLYDSTWSLAQELDDHARAQRRAREEEARQQQLPPVNDANPFAIQPVDNNPVSALHRLAAERVAALAARAALRAATPTPSPPPVALSARALRAAARDSRRQADEAS